MGSLVVASSLVDEVSFKNGSVDGLSFADVMATIADRLDMDSSYTLIVGTDSQVFQRGTIFVTGIVLLRDGKDAFACRGMYVEEEHLMKMRDKIMRETDITSAFLEMFESFLAFRASDVRLVAHMDVGLTESSDTRFVADEVLDQLAAYDCEVVMKPDAYVASGYANFYTKRGG